MPEGQQGVPEEGTPKTVVDNAAKGWKMQFGSSVAYAPTELHAGLDGFMGEILDDNMVD